MDAFFEGQWTKPISLPIFARIIMSTETRLLRTQLVQRLKAKQNLDVRSVTLFISLSLSYKLSQLHKNTTNLQKNMLLSRRMLTNMAVIPDAKPKKWHK